MPNPYDPQTPARPEYFGGRHAIIQKVRERIDMALQHKKSGGILIYGHRGVGKTSLINKIISEVSGTEEAPSKVMVARRSMTRTTNDQELYQLLTEEIKQQVEKRKSIIGRVLEGTKNIKSIGAAQFKLEISENVSGKSHYHLWKTYIENLKNADLILIALDDADYLSKEAIGELKTIVEEISYTPILLIISGFIDSEEKLVNNYSPVARIFSGANFNIGQFSREETEEVLTKPLAKERTKWRDGAIDIAHRVTAGYPYLVQCIASASYREGEIITEEIVRESIEQAVNIGRSWLNHEIPTASDQDIISFFRIGKLNKDLVKSTELSSIGVSPPYVGRLATLKVLKKISRGRYRVEKSPMIATFEMLKRGLVDKMQAGGEK